MPEAISSSALNSWILNEDTIRQVLHFVIQDRLWSEDWKDYYFAKNHDHAEKIFEIFNIEQIIEYLRNVGGANTAIISEKIGLSPARTRVILANMDEVEALGSNRNRTYRLKTDV